MYLVCTSSCTHPYTPQETAVEKAKNACALRGDHETVLKHVERVGALKLEIAALLYEQRDLQARADKAARDSGSRKAGKSLSFSTDPDASLPSIPDNLQGLDEQCLEVVRSVRHQLGQSETFTRPNTRFGRVHCSPMDAGLDNYIMAQKTLLLVNKDGPKSPRQLAIDAATAMSGLAQGGRKMLSSLWKEIGGPSGLGAQAKIEKLMKVPLAAIRMDSGDGQSAWIVIAKEPDVQYSRLDSVLSALEPLPDGAVLSSRPLISQPRLRALQALASSDVDRKLLMLAAIDGCSTTAVDKSGLLGTHNHGTAEQRTKREEALTTAFATFEAFNEIAQIRSLAEISIRLGTQILEEDVDAELKCLQERLGTLEAQEAGLPEVQEASPLAAQPAFQYHSEDVDQELLQDVDASMKYLEFVTEQDCEHLAEEVDWQNESCSK